MILNEAITDYYGVGQMTSLLLDSGQCSECSLKLPDRPRANSAVWAISTSLPENYEKAYAVIVWSTS